MEERAPSGNTDRRTALDSPKALKYDKVVAFLSEKGAKSNAPNPASKNPLYSPIHLEGEKKDYKPP